VGTHLLQDRHASGVALKKHRKFWRWKKSRRQELHYEDWQDGVSPIIGRFVDSRMANRTMTHAHS
jgi:hypothetical protein